MRFDCIHSRKATTKPQSVKGAFLRILTELQEPKQYFTDEKKKEVLQSSEKENVISCNLDSKQENKHAYNQPNNNGCDSLLSIFSLGDGNNYDATLAEELQTQKRKKKKGIRR